jgi:hypothetical protein
MMTAVEPPDESAQPPNDNAIKIDAASFVALAPIYIVAQALERFLEPFASRFQTTVAQKDALRLKREAAAAAKSKHDAAVKAAAADQTKAAAADALKEQLTRAKQAELNALATLRKVRSERGLILWAVATSFALLITAAFGFGLIAAIATPATPATPGGAALPGGFPDKDWLHALDVVLTGVAIGAGTKPLHDLITRVEKAKENSDPATKPAVPATTAA